ncbi:hypothetical protein E2542_SST18046 [Spatholobus suberectus]|nr:hypothetical protein E2542_SST18046 [Spatholobus suberectus]
MSFELRWKKRKLMVGMGPWYDHHGWPQLGETDLYLAIQRSSVACKFGNHFLAFLSLLPLSFGVLFSCICVSADFVALFLLSFFSFLVFHLLFPATDVGLSKNDGVVINSDVIGFSTIVGFSILN